MEVLGGKVEKLILKWETQKVGACIYLVINVIVFCSLIWEPFGI